MGSSKITTVFPSTLEKNAVLPAVNIQPDPTAHVSFSSVSILNSFYPTEKLQLLSFFCHFFSSTIKFENDQSKRVVDLDSSGGQ